MMIFAMCQAAIVCHVHSLKEVNKVLLQNCLKRIIESTFLQHSPEEI